VSRLQALGDGIGSRIGQVEHGANRGPKRLESAE
jgi:hypothetical protein